MGELSWTALLHQFVWNRSHIQEPTPFDPKWFSDKFEDPSVWYKVGICLQTGWIVWWNGVFPCGNYPDLCIVWQC